MRSSFSSVALGIALGLIVACGPTQSFEVPTGLPDDHVLLAVDYIVHQPELDGVYDPRLITLTADGTLVLERRDVDAVLGTTAKLLDDAELGQAWSAIVRSGVFSDGLLSLPGFAAHTTTTATNVFRVDDGTLQTTLTIDDLGSEQVFRGEPPIQASEMSLRAAATRLMDELRTLGGPEPWTPPALLMWWRPELPADANATIVPWTLPLDLATAGQAVDHPVWERCARVDGAAAAAVAELARSLPIDHLVEQDGARYAINLRPIHPDELDDVACP